MDTINPLANTLLQSTHVQRQQSADKSRQVRRSQALQKNVATRDDELEHQVESSEELAPVNDEHPEHEQSKRSKRDPRKPADQDEPSDTPPRLDLTA
jgi:hypothetical protein